VSFYFVYRSFYGMRIRTSRQETPRTRELQAGQVENPHS
jgi:hypothetical protein